MTSAGVLVSAAMIVRRRAVHIGPKPPQQFDLPLAKPRNIGKRLRPRKNRQKNQEQHLRERIIHFAGLTMIRQPAEIVKKTRRLRNLCQSRPVGNHHRPPPATQWMQQIQLFSLLSRTSSPDYPGAMSVQTSNFWNLARYCGTRSVEQ